METNFWGKGGRVPIALSVIIYVFFKNIISIYSLLIANAGRKHHLTLGYSFLEIAHLCPFYGFHQMTGFLASAL